MYSCLIKSNNTSLKIYLNKLNEGWFVVMLHLILKISIRLYSTNISCIYKRNSMNFIRDYTPGNLTSLLNELK